MTLLELLVQELPKRGGWPDGVARLAQDPNGDLQKLSNRDAWFMSEVGWTGYGREDFYADYLIRKMEVIADDHVTAIVTREQYEAASQKVEWDDSYPIKPGTDVEIHFAGDDFRVWTEFRVEYMRGDVVVLYDYRSDNVCAYSNRLLNFRPIRSEAEREINEMIRVSGVSQGAAKILYDAGYRKQ